MDTQTNLLSDDELDTVAGGMMMAFTPSPAAMARASGSTCEARTGKRWSALPLVLVGVL